ncbi:MAG: hypothetical protein QF464_11595, partial [Myxococcota bacterium]|jgi:hypothetical protein|nr:hypothetical protein [Myxococcota bacterium]
VIRLGDGREVVVYGDGTTGELWMATRGEGACWHRTLALSEGTWLWPNVAAMGGAAVGIVSVGLSLDDTLSARRELRSLTVPASTGTCP